MMDNDRELLERAAKAAGVTITGQWDISDRMYTTDGFWNPLTDDGDALRLAVKLALTGSIHITITAEGVVVTQPWPSSASATEHIDLAHTPDADRAEATRRAIVRAAAAIGEGRQS